MAPECLVPAETFSDDVAARLSPSGAPVPMCWYCAHLATDHGFEPDPRAFLAASDRCACERERVFPHRFASRLAPQVTEEDTLNAIEIAARQAVPRSTRVPARERQAQARAAAARTHLSRQKRPTAAGER